MSSQRARSSSGDLLVIEPAENKPTNALIIGLCVVFKSTSNSLFREDISIEQLFPPGETSTPALAFFCLCFVTQVELTLAW